MEGSHAGVPPMGPFLYKAWEASIASHALYERVCLACVSVCHLRGTRLASAPLLSSVLLKRPALPLLLIEASSANMIGSASSAPIPCLASLSCHPCHT
jgi:hypothetical protein